MALILEERIEDAQRLCKSKEPNGKWTLMNVKWTWITYTTNQIPCYFRLVPLYCILKIEAFVVALIWSPDLCNGLKFRNTVFNTLRLLREFSRQWALFVKGWYESNNVLRGIINATSDVVDAGTSADLEGPLFSLMTFRTAQTLSSKLVIDLIGRKSS